MVHLSLYKVADAPFQFQDDKLSTGPVFLCVLSYKCFQYAVAYQEVTFQHWEISRPGISDISHYPRRREILSTLD